MFHLTIPLSAGIGALFQFSFDFSIYRQVFVGKEEIDLTQTEYNIMAFLSVHAGKVLTYAAIIRAVWGYSDYGSVKKLQVNMKNIRKKMGVTPGEKRYIINELGVGYRMLAEDEA